MLPLCAAQAQLPATPPQPATSAPQAPSTHAGPSAQEGPGIALYRKLAEVGLDAKAVYSIRDAALEREDLHLTFEDGTIAFVESVDGRVTGAFFEGEGDLLLIPPNRAERGSLALFTGAAVMETKFTTAYLRFNDDTVAQLMPALRPAEDPQAFVDKWGASSKSMAESDTLRLMATYLNEPPPTGDRMLRVRLSTPQFGIFDVYFDLLSAEQIAVFKFSYGAAGVPYYDVLASFPMRSARRGESYGDAERSLVEATGTLNRLKVEKVTIEATVAPPQTLSADSILDISVPETGDRIAFFELSRNLKVSRVEAGGKPLEFLQNVAIEGSSLARRGNDIVAVVFPEVLRAGQHMRMKFTYSGNVLSEAGSGLLYVGARGIWFPNRGMIMSNYDLTFHYPSEWTLLATGRRVSQTQEAGITTARYVSERPIPVAGFNLGRYTRAEAKAGNIEVAAYAAPGVEADFAHLSQAPAKQPLATNLPDPAKNAPAIAEASARAIDFFAAKFGPYPYSSLALTQMPGDFGQAWPGLVFLSSYAYFTQDELVARHMTPAEALLYSRFMVVHETAHQWWGDMIGWKSYRDQWLIEALANYCAVLALEKEHPDETKAFLEYYRQSLLQKNERGEENALAGPVTLGMRLSSSHFPIGYNIVSYGRGLWLMHMLRTMFDDAAELSGNPPAEEPFLAMLRRLRDNYEGQELSTRDFQAEVEQQLPATLRFEGRPSLDWFFEGWVNGTAIPRLELREVHLPRKGATVATALLLQKEAPDDLLTSVPIYAETASTMKLVARVMADGQETRLRLAVPAGTRKLVVDPYNTILKRP